MTLAEFPDESRIGLKGFVYVPDDKPGVWTNSKVSDVARLSEPPPPWLVVHHTLDSVLFTSWPGSLWFVEITEPAPCHAQVTEFYTRAKEVRLLEKAPPYAAFGPHGESVARVLNRAMKFTLAEIENAPRPRKAAQKAYSRAWNCWVGQHVDSKCNGSPVGGATSLLSDIIDKLAKKFEGDAAFIVDEEGEISSTEKWNQALLILLYAVMALGAPELLSELDRQALLHGWNEWMTD